MASEPPPDCDSTGPECIRSCTDMPDGDYQSCDSCYVYVTCSNGGTYDERPCPAGLVWDDIVKRCEWQSNTCQQCPTNLLRRRLEGRQLPKGEGDRESDVQSENLLYL